MKVTTTDAKLLDPKDNEGKVKYKLDIDEMIDGFMGNLDSLINGLKTHSPGGGHLRILNKDINNGGLTMERTTRNTLQLGFSCEIPGSEIEISLEDEEFENQIAGCFAAYRLALG